MEKTDYTDNVHLNHRMTWGERKHTGRENDEGAKGMRKDEKWWWRWKTKKKQEKISEPVEFNERGARGTDYMGYLLLCLIYLSHNTLAHIYTLTFTNVDSHMLRFSKSDNLAVFWQKENHITFEFCCSTGGGSWLGVDTSPPELKPVVILCWPEGFCLRFKKCVWGRKIMALTIIVLRDDWNGRGNDFMLQIAAFTFR